MLLSAEMQAIRALIICHAHTHTQMTNVLTKCTDKLYWQNVLTKCTDKCTDKMYWQIVLTKCTDKFTDKSVFLSQPADGPSIVGSCIRGGHKNPKYLYGFWPNIEYGQTGSCHSIVVQGQKRRKDELICQPLKTPGRPLAWCCIP